MRRTTLTLTLLASLCCLAGTALAAQQPLPPGNSAVDEYTEGVPHAGGERGPGNNGGGSAGGGTTTVTPTAGDTGLRKLGKQGAAAADLAKATAPTIDRTGPADSPGSNGFGILPWILAISLLGAVGVLLARHFRGGEPAS